MKVSFVIPTRNQARFIRRCIDSCLNQTIPESEIIVIDGLSNDGTQEILQQYGSRVKWVSEADSGQAEAVNKGIKRSTGEIIAWINSDDYYPESSTLRTVMESFGAAPDIDIVYGLGTLVDADGKVLGRYIPPPLHSAVDLLMAPNGPLQPATFFRRSLFVAAGELRTDLHYAMDYDLWLRMFPRARSIRHLRQPLACATFHSKAKSVAGVWQQIRELCRVKHLHRHFLALTPTQEIRFVAGLVSLYAYGCAVKLGLRRLT